MGFYDDPRYGVIQTMVLSKGADAAIGSANAARAVLNRRTVLKSITVKDWNLEVVTGATCTSPYTLAIGKSAAGTGAIATFGTAQVGTQANASVVDASLTETNFTAGDDIVFSAEVGTALGDNSLVARANVSYVERYTE